MESSVLWHFAHSTHRSGQCQIPPTLQVVGLARSSASWALCWAHGGDIHPGGQFRRPAHSQMNGGRSAAQSQGRWGAQAQEQPGRPRPQQPLANQPGPRDPPPSPTKTSANERGPAPLGAHRCSHIIVQIKFFGALNFFFKAPAAFAAAAGDSGRFPAPPLPVPPPGAGAAVWARVSPPPAGRAWCWAPGPPRLSRGAQGRWQ